MGTTGSHEKVAVNAELPEILARIRSFTDIPLAVGFGVSTRDHFNYVSDAGADGVVIGSKIVNVIKSAPEGQVYKAVQDYCAQVCGKTDAPRVRSPPISVKSTPADESGEVQGVPNSNVLPPRFGQFGGQYVPESLVDCLAELEEAHKSAMADPAFWKEFRDLFGYMNRPSQLYFAENLTKEAGGANIWLKREDLNHTGSHKINNAIGQV